MQPWSSSMGEASKTTLTPKRYNLVFLSCAVLAVVSLIGVAVGLATLTRTDAPVKSIQVDRSVKTAKSGASNVQTGQTMPAAFGPVLSLTSAKVLAASICVLLAIGLVSYVIYRSGALNKNQPEVIIELPTLDTEHESKSHVGWIVVGILSLFIVGSLIGGVIFLKPNGGKVKGAEGGLEKPDGELEDPRNALLKSCTTMLHFIQEAIRRSPTIMKDPKYSGTAGKRYITANAVQIRLLDNADYHISEINIARICQCAINFTDVVTSERPDDIESAVTVVSLGPTTSVKDLKSCYWILTRIVEILNIK